MSRTVQRKKWWEVATTQDELDLFHLLARHPKYGWRSVDSVLRKLRWTPDRLQSVAGPFFRTRIIVEKNTKKGFMIGYWERVNDQNDEIIEENEQSYTDKNLYDPNLI